jgi:hypothetical protein
MKLIMSRRMRYVGHLIPTLTLRNSYNLLEKPILKERGKVGKTGFNGRILCESGLIFSGLIKMPDGGLLLTRY